MLLKGEKNYPNLNLSSRHISFWWILKNLWKTMSVLYNLLR